MNRRHTLAILAVTALLWGPWAMAQEAPKPRGPWFTVEVVVFANNSDRGLTEEIWPFDPGQPDLGNAVALGRDGMPLLDSRPGELPPLLPVDSSQWELQGVVRVLRRSAAYTPLLHLAWRQAGRDKSRALPVLVRAGASGDPLRPPTLEGTIRVYLSRYLHLEADLVYSRDDPSAIAATSGTPNQGENPTGMPTVEPLGQPVPARFRLTQSRRMRSNEIHYIDHPIFGIIAQITPYQFPEERLPAPAVDTAPPSAPDNATATGSGSRGDTGDAAR